MVDAIESDTLTDEQAKLKDVAPLPMNSTLAKQCPLEALRIRKERKQMKIEDVPATGKCF